MDLSKQKETFAKAFTEWERRFREEPEAFMSQMETASQTVASVGEAQANYFITLLDEIAQQKVKGECL